VPPAASSNSNVRTVKTGVSIEELSQDIAHRGLLQNLYVRPVIGTDGEETSFYELPAGGGRYRALERLVKGKRLDKAVPVPCIVRDTESPRKIASGTCLPRSSCAALRRIQAALVLVLRRLVSVDVPLHKIANNLRRGSTLILNPTFGFHSPRVIKGKPNV
jgi:hypothetical protein